MRWNTRIYSFLLTGLAMALSLTGQPTADPAGTWVGKIDLNSGGSTAITVVLRIDGKDYRGTIADELGLLPENTELESVSFSGNELKFSCQAHDDTGIVAIKVTLKVEGETMAGRWDDEQNGTGGAIELKRKNAEAFDFS